MYNLILDVTQSVHAAARTAVFFSKVLPMLPSRAVDWVTSDPIVSRVRYPTPEGEREGDLYRPASSGPHPGVIVCLGVVPFEVDHPQVPRLGAALARAGFATLLYWSPAMRDLRLDPEDVDGIALAYRWLIDQPYVDPARSGLLGTCVGGSFALMAAAQPSIRDHVSFVTAWAPYSSMRSLACSIASATTLGTSERVPWNIDQLTRSVYVRSLTHELPFAEAETLRIHCAERASRQDPGELSEDGALIYPLLGELNPEMAEDAINRLTPAMQQRLDAMSPMTYVVDIRAPLVILAHDRDDQVIPIGESRELRAVLSEREGTRYTEFTMFKHLDPTKVRLPVFALLRELGKFYLSVYPIFSIAVSRRVPRTAHHVDV